MTAVPEGCTMADGWEEIVVPARIKGTTLFREFLIIATDGGVFLAPSAGIEDHKHADDHLFVKLTAEARDNIFIIGIGDLPHRLEQKPIADLRVAQNAASGRFDMWSKDEEPQ
jgi:hypothetical protein